MKKYEAHFSTVSPQELQHYSAPVLAADNKFEKIYKQLAIILAVSLTGAAVLLRLRNKYSHCFIPFL